MKDEPPPSEKPYLFLLGGQDLEMQTIRDLLLAQGYREGIDFIDHKLAWHQARLSAYSAFLAIPKKLVGIELSLDIAPPAGYLSIDHHGARSEEESSLEQFAALMGITLSREQRLIAANDSGYIPAMQALGATPGEIAHIRQLDRKAQGVTPEMEQQAEADLIHNLREHGPLTVVQTQLETFSPLTDRLFGRPHLLIYNDATLTYYGSSRNQVVAAYQPAIQEGRAYYGGQSPGGYFGLAKGHWTASQLTVHAEKIMHLITDA